MKDVVEIYLKPCENRTDPLRPGTLAKKKRILDTFVYMYGSLQARSIKERHVSDWLDAKYAKCNSTSKRDRICEPQAVWNFAQKRGLVRLNPLVLIKKPEASQRTHYVPKEQWENLLKHCHPKLRDIVEFMLYSGARAQEAVIVVLRV